MYDVYTIDSPHGMCFPTVELSFEELGIESLQDFSNSIEARRLKLTQLIEVMSRLPGRNSETIII